MQKYYSFLYFVQCSRNIRGYYIKKVLNLEVIKVKFNINNFLKRKFKDKNVIFSLICLVAIIVLLLIPTGFQKAIYTNAEGVKVKILEVNNTGNIRRRLLDLGFIPGVMVSAILQSPFKDPIAYKIKNTVIALRNEDSKQILVEVLKWKRKLL